MYSRTRALTLSLSRRGKRRHSHSLSHVMNHEFIHDRTRTSGPGEITRSQHLVDSPGKSTRTRLPITSRCRTKTASWYIPTPTSWSGSVHDRQGGSSAGLLASPHPCLQ